MREKTLIIKWYVCILSVINGLCFGLVVEFARQLHNNYINTRALESNIIKGTEVVSTVDMLHWYTIPFLSVLLFFTAGIFVHRFFVNRPPSPLIFWQAVGITAVVEAALISLSPMLTNANSVNELFSLLQGFIIKYKETLLLLLIGVAVFNLIYGTIIRLSESYYSSHKLYSEVWTEGHGYQTVNHQRDIAGSD